MGKKKLKNRGGFTLAETLLAVAILLLVSAIVATGMPAAKNAYEKVVLASNAEVLLSTAASALRDELGTAWNVQTKGTGVTYFSASTGTRTELTIDGTIKIKEYAKATTIDKLLGTNQNSVSAEERELVFLSEDEKKKYALKADYIKPDTDKVVISNLRVEHNGEPITEKMTLNIPVFSVDPTTAA